TTDSALDGSGKSADDYAGEQVDVGSGAATGSSGKGGGFGNFASDGGSAKDSSNRVHGGTQKALTGFNASAPTQASIKSTENANPRAAATPIPYGTSAVVQGGATLTAGHAIGVTANESDSIR